MNQNKNGSHDGDASETEVLLPSNASLRGLIYVVDDDRDMRELLRDFLSKEGYQVQIYDRAFVAIDDLNRTSVHGHGLPDLIISDIRMPEMDGLEFTTKVLQLPEPIPIVLMTAFGSIETAVEAMKRGAFHYIVKPFKLAEMSVVVERALEHRQLRAENQVLRQQLRGGAVFGGIIGKSPAMKAVFEMISRVASATANVLITGPSGSGKEMVARAIHQTGHRQDQPFVAINCSAIPDTLLESELFGHAKGSFTGAVQRKRGLFEEAQGGTLFLDEIGDMNVLLQSKLLRVIQEKKIRAVGDNIDRPIDVRIIAATHKDLKLAIKEGRFREDLFYRLSVIPVVIPSLAERREDIPLLAESFLQKYAASNGLKVRGFTRKAMQKLMNLRWEGNVRELENVIERAVVLGRNPYLDDVDIPGPESTTAEDFFVQSTKSNPTIADLEARYMRLVLEKTGGRKDKAAQILGISRRTLYRKEREYGLVPEGSPEEEPLKNEEEDAASTN